VILTWPLILHQRTGRNGDAAEHVVAVLGDDLTAGQALQLAAGDRAALDEQRRDATGNQDESCAGIGHRAARDYNLTTQRLDGFGIGERRGDLHVTPAGFDDVEVGAATVDGEGYGAGRFHDALIDDPYIDKEGVQKAVGVDRAAVDQCAWPARRAYGSHPGDRVVDIGQRHAAADADFIGCGR